WCYLLVAGAEGRLILDQTPVVLYRQHAGSLVGAASSLRKRAILALRRGPGAFMGLLRQHVAALIEQPDLLAPSSLAQTARIANALRRGPVTRLRVLCMPGFGRQSWLETFLFRLWFVLG
ncbi:MAG: glycosyltransferase, partial [Acetobacteraceae bacterium]